MPSILQSRKGYREEAQKGDGSPEYKVREVVGLDSLQRTVFWGKRRNKKGVVENPSEEPSLPRSAPGHLGN